MFAKRNERSKTCDRVSRDRPHGPRSHVPFNVRVEKIHIGLSRHTFESEQQPGDMVSVDEVWSGAEPDDDAAGVRCTLSVVLSVRTNELAFESL